jgi:hypothetical protein
MLIFFFLDAEFRGYVLPVHKSAQCVVNERVSVQWLKQ